MYHHNFNAMYQALQIIENQEKEAYGKFLLRMVKSNENEMVRKLLDDKIFFMPTSTLHEALEIAVHEKNECLVEKLMLRGALPIALGEKGNTLLHVAATFDTNAVALMLINCGADIQSKNLYDETPIHIACEDGDLELVQVLSKKGSNMKAVNAWGQNCLFYACLNQAGDEVLRYLLDSGDVDINTQDYFGNNLVSFKFIRGNCEWSPDCQTLVTCLMYGAKLLEQNDSGRCSCEDHGVPNDNCPVAIFLAKLSTLNAPLAMDLCRKMGAHEELIDCLQIRYASKVINEVELLQQLILSKNHCMVNLLTKGRHELAKPSDDTNLKNLIVLTNNELSSRFPVLGKALTIIIKKAANRKKLVQKGEMILPLLIGTNIPSNQVVPYLSNVQLSDLLKSTQWL